MNKKQIERRLRHAGAQLPLPGFECIADLPVRRMEENDYITRQPAPRPLRRYRRVLAAAGACCALALAAGLGWFAALRTVDSVVFLDVNPSLQITANRRETVLEVTALNPEAEALLQGGDYRGQPLEQAVDGLVERLAEQGYLTAENSTVLLSVQNKSGARAQRLEEGLAASIERALAPRGIQPKLVSQTLAPDAGAASQAAGYQISAGRLRYIQQLLASTDDYTLEQLAGMNMEQLAALAAGEAEDPDDEDDTDDGDDEDGRDHEDEDEDAEDDRDEDEDRDEGGKTGDAAAPAGARQDDEDDEEEGQDPPERPEPDDDDDEDEDEEQPRAPSSRSAPGPNDDPEESDGPEAPEPQEDPEDPED